MTKDKAKRPHHHGNLREALISAGLEILERDGTAALTLRKCAAIAGVSHAAPANHFNGLVSLKVSIVARGHLLFADMMRQTSIQVDGSPRAQLHAICSGYISFARKHGALFKFMFQPYGEEIDEVDAVSWGEKRQAAGASYDILHQACRPFEHKGENALNTETMIWSLVHGYAMLFCDEDCSTPGGDLLPSFTDILPELKLRDDAHKIG